MVSAGPEPEEGCGLQLVLEQSQQADRTPSLIMLLISDVQKRD